MTGSMRAISDAEVAVLGLLAEKPKHPWQIEKDVEFRDMRSWTDLSASTIYKRLQALERDGMVSSEAEIVEGRARKVYAISDAGRTALAARLLDLLAEPDVVKSRIDIATYNIDLVPARSAIEALRTYRAALESRVSGYRDLEQYLRTSGCPPHRMAVARRPVHLLEAEVRWVDEFIGTLEGID